MRLSEQDKPPKTHETLADYIHRLRKQLGLSQQQVALKAGIHPQSLGKLERGKTSRLNRKTQRGLAYALQIPGEYLDAVVRGETISTAQTLKFCPRCWKAGTPPEPEWLNIRAHFCFECGASLTEHCPKCNAAITSLKHRFCPFCGTCYTAKTSKDNS